MKKSRFHLVLLALFGLSTLTINAAQLASAKVLSVSGAVTSYSADDVKTPLVVGDILTQGDSVVSSGLSSALLVFSNGSEITVEENSSVTLAELSQEAFSGNKSYEQLQADPSKSQSLLELNYGKVAGHVKQLRPGSRFDIETPLGTAAIRGTQFEVSIGYNAERGEFTMTVLNKDGKVDVISRFPGSVSFGRSTVAQVSYAAGAESETSESLPPAHTIVLRISKDDPYFRDVINAVKNYPPFQNNGTPPNVIDVAPPGPTFTPEDQDTVIASPNLPV
jgi:hypothetical protein